MGTARRQGVGVHLLPVETTVANTPVAVCELPCPWGKCPAGRGSLLDAVEYQIGTVVPRRMVARYPPALAAPPSSPLLLLLHRSKVCFEVAPRYHGENGLSVGTHIIRLRVTKKDTYVLLTHLIWF